MYIFITNLSIQLFLIFFISCVTKFVFIFRWFCDKSTKHEKECHITNQLLFLYKIYENRHIKSFDINNWWTIYG